MWPDYRLILRIMSLQTGLDLVIGWVRAKGQTCKPEMGSGLLELFRIKSSPPWVTPSPVHSRTKLYRSALKQPMMPLVFSILLQGSASVYWLP